MADRLLKLLFRDIPVRAEFIRLDEAWQQMIAHHAHPEPVLTLLGQVTAAAALLTSSIKFAGTLILQIHGDGPVKLLVAECQSDLRIRATAKLRDGAVVAPDADLRALVNHGGSGRCALTLDPRDGAPEQLPYQGIVALEGATMAAALETYMARSEQVETRFWLAADANACCGLLLQKLPREGGQAGATDPDGWDRAQALAETLTAAEMLTAEPDVLAQRLFWQEITVSGQQQQPRFTCSCSRSRIGKMLLALGRAEVDSIVAEFGQVGVTCDFCNRQHQFDAVDVVRLFTTGSTELSDRGPVNQTH